MTALRPILFVLALAAAPLIGAMPAAAQGVQDFQLPPSASESPSEPAVQGPVDDSGIVARPPRAVNTPQPVQSTPARPQPSPSASPQEAPSGAATSAPPLPANNPATGPILASPSASPTPTATDSGFAPLPSQAPLPTASPAPPEEVVEAGTWMDYWPWLAAALAVLLGGLGWVWRARRIAAAPPAEIERPIVTQPSRGEAALPAPVAAPIASSGNGVALKLEAISLSRSMLNVTLSYRLAVTNRTLATIDRLTISGDLASAKHGVAIGQQTADAATQLAPIHEVERLTGKQTKDLAGKLVMPVAQINAVRPGAPLYVPLLRLRIDGIEDGPKFHTFVIGMLPNVAGGKLQPFRIDEQPQNYSRIGQQPVT